MCTLAKVARLTWREIIPDTKGWMGIVACRDNGAPAFLLDMRLEVFERHCRASKESNAKNGTLLQWRSFPPGKTLIKPKLY